MILIKKFSKSDSTEWNDFVRKAKNATFMLDRNFIEYHEDRFEDYSLLIYDDKGLIALLPANKISESIISSHSGLTYGGIIVGEKMSLLRYLSIFNGILKFLNSKGFQELRLKVLPDFYCNLPSQESLYALFLVDAKKHIVNTTLTIDQSSRSVYQKRRLRSIQKADKINFDIRKDNQFKSFWNNILTPNLFERFGVKPVHSVEEIILLNKLFPDNISQVNIYLDDKIVAGATIFETNHVAHAQYISSNDYGRNSGALDLLFDKLITHFYKHKKYFDFGICNEENGLRINNGLLDWKEGFGGKVFVHEIYSITISQNSKIDLLIGFEQYKFI